MARKNYAPKRAVSRTELAALIAVVMGKTQAATFRAATKMEGRKSA